MKKIKYQRSGPAYESKWFEAAAWMTIFAGAGLLAIMLALWIMEAL